MTDRVGKSGSASSRSTAVNPSATRAARQIDDRICCELTSWLARLAIVLLLIAVSGGLLFVLVGYAELECAGTRQDLVGIQLAGTHDRASLLLSDCSAGEVRAAMIRDVPLIGTYVGALWFGARYFGRRGYRIKRLRSEKTTKAVAGISVAAGLFDLIENGLTALFASSGWHWLAVAVAALAWAKFLLIFLAAVYLLGAMIGYVVTPKWVIETRDGWGSKVSTGADPITPTNADGSSRGLGIAMSGGGIRAASFGLGVLQGLERTGSGETGLAWKGAKRVTAVSGGAYMASAWAISRMGRGPSGDPPRGSANAWGDPPQGEPELRHLRSKLGYLLQREGGFPGTVAVLTAGVLVNSAVLLGLLFLISRPIGWLVSSCSIAPSLKVPYGEGGVSREVTCALLGVESVTREVSFGWHLTGPPLIWLAVGLVSIAIWVLSGRLISLSSSRNCVSRWLGGRALAIHGSFGVMVAPLALGVVLFALLVAVPYAMLNAPEWYMGLASTVGSTDGDSVGKANSVIQVLVGLGVIGAIWGLLRKQLAKWANKLGGVLLGVFAVGLGGRWASDAAIAIHDPKALGALSFLKSELRLWLAILCAWLIACIISNPEWWSMAPFYRSRLRSAFATYRAGNEASSYRGSDLDPRNSEPSVDEYQAGSESPCLVVAASMAISEKSVRTHYGIPSGSFTFEVGNPGNNSVAFSVATSTPANFESYLCDSQRFEQLMYRRGSPRLTTILAAALSGAAFAPTMGRQSSGTTGAAFAFANLRLGMWLPNPRFVEELGPPEPSNDYKRPEKPIRWLPYPRIRISYLLKEIFGIYDPEDLYVYVTDGGHWENTAIVEALRPHDASEVIAIDASGSGSLVSLAEAISLAPLEHGAEIEIGLDVARADDRGIAERCWTVGLVSYPAAPPGGGQAECALLWYVRATLTPDSPARLLAIRERDRDFPNHSTLDQFFDEEQFESYRLLGHFAAERIAEARAELSELMVRAPDLESFSAAVANGSDASPGRVAGAELISLIGLRPDPDAVYGILRGVVTAGAS